MSCRGDSYSWSSSRVMKGSAMAASSNGVFRARCRSPAEVRGRLARGGRTTAGKPGLLVSRADYHGRRAEREGPQTAASGARGAGTRQVAVCHLGRTGEDASVRLHLRTGTAVSVLRGGPQSRAGNGRDGGTCEKA